MKRELLNFLNDMQSAIEASAEQGKAQSESIEAVADVLKTHEDLHKLLLAQQMAIRTLLALVWAHVLMQEDDPDKEADEFRPWVLEAVRFDAGDSLDVDAHEHLIEIAEEVAQMIRSRQP